MGSEFTIGSQDCTSKQSSHILFKEFVSELKENKYGDYYGFVDMKIVASSLKAMRYEIEEKYFHTDDGYKKLFAETFALYESDRCLERYDYVFDAYKHAYDCLLDSFLENSIEGKRKLLMRYR